MALALAVFSLFAQAISFLGIGFLVADLLVLPRVFYPDGNWTIAGLLPYALETGIGYWPVFLLAAIGVAVSALLLTRGSYRATWYLHVCRILGWVWMPLLPIGPAFGAVLLRSRLHVLRSESQRR